MENIRDAVRCFIVDNFIPGESPDALGDETDLKESGILDSLSTLKLVSFLESQFHIEFEAEDLNTGSLSSLVTIERLVQSKMGAR